MSYDVNEYVVVLSMCHLIYPPYDIYYIHHMAYIFFISMVLSLSIIWSLLSSYLLLYYIHHNHVYFYLYLLLTPRGQTSNGEPEYRNIVTSFRTIWRIEGMRGMSRGLAPSLFGLVHVAIQFPLYERFKSLFLEYRTSFGHVVK